ncbi:MAG: hypothetical protein WC769_01475 [Thermodesulfovibrionales bacterium]|jgi:hypothetical protein
MNHIETGLMNFKNELPVFCVLLLMADHKTGTVLTNAKILAERLRENLKIIQFALYKLREKKYIHYDDHRGRKGSYNIYINKYRIWLTRDLAIYTSIFRENGFIGEQVFNAQMKVCNLYPKLGSGYRLSFQSFRLPTDFTIDFVSDFKTFLQGIDSYTTNSLVNNALIDFTTDFTLDKSQTLIIDAYKEIYIYIKKSANLISFKESPDEADTKRIHSLCDQLKVLNLNHGFNPYTFWQMNINEKIPYQVTERILLQLMKYKPKNAWGYAKEILRQDYQHRSFAEALEKHEEMKSFDFADALKKVKVID